MSMLALRLDDPMMFVHTPVLVEPVVQLMSPKPQGLYIDATAGGGGHSAALLRSCSGAQVIAFDRDPEAVRAASVRLSVFGHRAEVAHASFDGIPAWLGRRNISKVDGILADLGVSSHQLDTAERGMSFRGEGPLDMRMDPTRGPTLLELLRSWTVDELADVLYVYGEERRSRRVARCIKRDVELDELRTTLDLRRSVVRAVGPYRVGGVDPATRTFQALRIAVNAELEQLSGLLVRARELLVPGGVLAVISFHSLEDRLVKREFAQADTWERLVRKPVVASEAESEQNSRSRSAKLRAARLLERSPSEPGRDEQLFALRLGRKRR
jgi:16S rRNA (cytosine1402-N4)-methyltransferase